MEKSGKKLILFAFLAVLLLAIMPYLANAAVVINEFLPRGVSDPDSEWVEIFNNGTSSVNLTDWNLTDGEGIFTIPNISINSQEFIILTENATFFNSTYVALNNSGLKIIDYGPQGPTQLSLANSGDDIALKNSSGSVVDNVSYADANTNVPIGRHPDASSKIINLSIQTPGKKNDNASPVLNKWIRPSANDSFVKGLLNITVNITDAASTVNATLIELNFTNFSMQKDNDLWFFAWNTSLNIEKAYNLTVFFNDSNGFKSSNILFNVTVDNSKPNITFTKVQTNSRNFVSPGFEFHANATLRDVNFLNVTCLLNGTTVGFFANSSNNYTCNLTAPLLEDNYLILFTAIDKANNTNTTTFNFTTKYTTSASLSPSDLTVSNMNQSSKIVQINATLTNSGSNPIFDARIVVTAFSSSSLSSPSTNKTCSANINLSQSCNVSFNVTIAGGTSGTSSVFWNAEWTDNNFTGRSFTQAITSTITISSNPQITAANSTSAAIQHGQNATLTFDLNSTGNSELQNVNINFIPITLLNSSIKISPNNFSSLAAGSNNTFNVTVIVPKHTNPGNLTGILNISATSTLHKTLLLTVEVPLDDTWKLSPNFTKSFKQTGFAGLLGNITINNTGNIGQNFSISYSGDLFFFIWNQTLADNTAFSSNAHIYVERSQSKSFSILHKDDGPFQTYGLTISIQSRNTSKSNISMANLTRDDASPFINITKPFNNSFVKEKINFTVNSTDLNLSRIEYYINKTLVLSSSDINFTFVWNTSNGSFSDEIYILEAIAFDSAGNSNSSTINVTINNTDDKPIFLINIPQINITEDNDSTILNLSLFFRSLDGDSLKYNFTRTGTNVTVNVDNTTQIASFTPQANFSGLNFIIFTAIDSNSDTASSNNITINVSNVNDAPTTPNLISPSNNANLKLSSGLVSLLWNTSIDADNDAVTYFVFFSNNSNNVSLNTTPVNTTTASTNVQFLGLKNGTYFWNIIAGDGNLNASRSSTFQFTLNSDTAPTIAFWKWNNTLLESTINTTKNLTPIISENLTIKFNIVANDTDNDNLTFAWFLNKSQKSAAQNFTFNFTSNFTSAGIYNITIVVQDNNTNEVRETWNLTITNVNRAPTTTQISDQSIVEETANTSLNLSLFFSDEDIDDNITFFAVSQNSSKVQCSINNINNLTLIGSANFSGNGSNAAKCTIVAFDGNINSTNNTFSINVSNLIDAPKLVKIGNLTASINALFTFDVNASDPDNDTLRFITNSTLFTINANTGIINFTPSVSQVGSHSINVTVNDSTGLKDTETILFAVGNSAPQIISFFPSDNKTIASETGSQKFNVTFTDPDESDSPIASWFRNKTSIAPSNASNVTISGLSTGVYNITVIINDTSNAVARYEWKLIVTGSINSTELTSPILSLNETQRQSVTNVTVNQTTFGGVDFGNNSLNFSGIANLEDAFNISQGFISVNTNTFKGLNKSASLLMKGLNFTKAPLIFMASGFESTSNSELCPAAICTNITYDSANDILRFNVAHFTTFFTQTNSTNGAPIITSTPKTSGVKSTQYNYDVDATDPDGNTLTFSLITSPFGMSINSNSGLISFNPSSLGAFNVTVLVTDGNLTGNQSYNLTITEGAKLRISDLDVEVDDGTDKNLDNNSRISDEAKPGSRVQFKIEIENGFTNADDLEIENIETDVTIEEIDDGDDLEEEADEIDLDPGDEDKIEVSFDVPLEVDEDTYDVVIRVEGEDQNGTIHDILFNLKLDVEKESHELSIVRTAVTPSIVRCQKTVSINAEIANTGAHDEDDVTLEILNQELGINSITNNIELEEGTDDNRFTKLATSTINNDVASGTYPITINTYYDGKLSDTEDVNLVVQQCEQTKEVKKEVKKEKPQVQVIKPEAIKEEEPIEVSFLDSLEEDEYLTLLTVLITVFIGATAFIIGSAVILLKK